MSTSLIDALQQVDLKAGQIYERQVGNLQVEVRVKANTPDLLPAPLNLDNVMIDSWVDLPSPQPGTFLQTTSGGSVVLDTPEIPKNWNEQ